MFSVVNSSVGAPTGRPKLGNSAGWNHPEMGVKNLEPYHIMALQMFYGFVHKTFVFGGLVPENPQVPPPLDPSVWYGHLTMMGNPSDDCRYPYEWIQMVVE